MCRANTQTQKRKPTNSSPNDLHSVVSSQPEHPHNTLQAPLVQLRSRYWCLQGPKVAQAAQLGNIQCIFRIATMSKMTEGESKEEDSFFMSNADKPVYVRSLDYYDNRWCLITETRPLNSQAVLVCEDLDFPLDRVKKYWDAGKYISHVGYGDGVWVVLADDDGQEHKQYLNIEVGEFADSQIQSLWKQNRLVTFFTLLENHKDKPYVIISEDKPPVIQKEGESYEEKSKRIAIGQSLGFCEDELPTKEIQAIYAAKRVVLSVSFISETKQWAILSQVSHDDRGMTQSYTANSDFSELLGKVEAKKDLRVNCLCYSPVHEAWVVTLIAANGFHQTIASHDKVCPCT